MADPRSRLVVLVALVGSAVYAQGPFETREPPFADGDEPVRLAQYTTTAAPPATPSRLPGELLGPGVFPAQYTRVGSPAGELPTPVVTLHLEGSETTPTGQPVLYKLHVRNQSRTKAHNVVVKVIPPKDVTRVKHDPPPTSDEAETRWEFKFLEPGESRTIELVYQPNAGVDEVKLLARVQFDFGRGMITKVSAPTLSVKRDGPERMIVGESGSFRITVRNTGKVTIRDIEVREFLNQGVVYDDREPARGAVDGRLTSSTDPKTGERTWSIPTLAPGQTQVLDYRLKAREAGGVRSTVKVKAGTLTEETSGSTEVLTATLQMKAEGPQSGKGTVGQPALYKVVVENKGSADLKNVAVRCTMPPDMRATRATNGGQPFRDSVQWTFKELKPGEVKELNVGLTTTKPGNRTVQFSARANHGAAQQMPVTVNFIGMSDLDWDLQGPGIEAVNKSFTYRIVVLNRGSAPGMAKVQADLAQNLVVEDSDPPAGQGFGKNAKEVNFPPIEIMPGKKKTFLIKVRAREAGEAKTIFRLTEDGREPKLGDRVTNITPTDTRGPAGPPPKSVDRSRDG
jgi:uncharacterized repeat protein (TIGR01451 family)